MRRWIPVAMGGLIVLAYAFTYFLGESGAQTAGSLGIVNSIGLAVMVIGLFAAGILLRRSARTEERP
jgi:hypothetical protein